MEKYTLNKTPLNTSKNYGINDIELELEIPKYETPDNYEIESNIKIEQQEKSKLTSKIGLNFDKYHNIEINIPKNSNNEIIINYDFKNNTLIDQIEINANKNSNTNIILKYTSKKNVFHHLKQITNLEENSKLNITLLNLLENDSKNFIAIENNLDKNTELTHNIIDLSSGIQISNYNTKLNEQSKNYLNNIYIGKNNDLIDINYNVELYGKESICNINSYGAIDDNSKKSFKGTIDFKEGAKKAVGEELEKCIILSKTAKSKSLPMLLCHEEDVVGAHGVSSGSIEKEKLFYLMSRGLTEKEAKNLIIKSNFNKLIENVPNKNTQEEIIEYIDKKLK